jgi:hypothetical protein
MSTRNSNGPALSEKVQTHPDGSKEYWRDVPGYGGRYRVSDYGRIKSVGWWVFSDIRDKQGNVITTRRTWLPGIMRKPTVSTKGRLMVLMRELNNTVRNRYLHQLVLEAFVGPRPKGMVVRHFPDRNPTNNKLENLCWGTKAENVADMRIHGTIKLMGRRGEKHNLAKLTWIEVRAIRQLSLEGWSLARLTAKYKGVISRSNLWLIITGKTWKED